MLGVALAAPTPGNFAGKKLHMTALLCGGSCRRKPVTGQDCHLGGSRVLRQRRSWEPPHTSNRIYYNSPIVPAAFDVEGRARACPKDGKEGKTIKSGGVSSKGMPPCQPSA